MPLRNPLKLQSRYMRDTRKSLHGAHYQILNAIFYMLRSGCPWRLLPHDLPPWKTVYHYFRLWRVQGLWERVHAMLHRALRVQEGRDPHPSAAIIDSQWVGSSSFYNGERLHQALNYQTPEAVYRQLAKARNGRFPP